jgi:hypothetical protein
MILEVQYWKYESFQVNFVTTYTTKEHLDCEVRSLTVP